jgi:starvation-inducible DNA-binding protein
MRHIRESSTAGTSLRPTIESSRAEREMPTESSTLLNAVLADEYVVYVRTLNFHWNVRGMQFHSLHDFFEMLYGEQFKRIDDLAERVRTLGANALGTMADFLKHSRLQEQVGEPPDPCGMISSLCEGHETLIRHLHEVIRTLDSKYDDPGTVNFLTDMLQEHEKTLWMLRVHLDRELG